MRVGSAGGNVQSREGALRVIDRHVSATIALPAGRRADRCDAPFVFAVAILIQGYFVHARGRRTLRDALIWQILAVPLHQRKSLIGMGFLWCCR